MARFAVWTRPRARPMLSPQTMRIAAIDPLVVHVPLRAPVQGVHGETTVQQSVLVRVTEADGLEGWGDVDPTPGYSLASAVEIRRSESTRLNSSHQIISYAVFCLKKKRNNDQYHS